MGETKNPHVYDSGLLNPSPSPTTFFIFGDTRIRKYNKSRKSLQQLKKWTYKQFDIFRKDRHRQIPKIRRIKL